MRSILRPAFCPEKKTGVLRDRDEEKCHFGRIRWKFQIIGACHHTRQVRFWRIATVLFAQQWNRAKEGWWEKRDYYMKCEKKSFLWHWTLRTMVSLGFRDAKPPGGNRGHPVTNCRNARCCFLSNSCKISNNWNTDKLNLSVWSANKNRKKSNPKEKIEIFSQNQHFQLVGC